MKNIFNADYNGVFIIAELSANHNGSKQTAIETIKAAKRAGADAIKLQTYTAESMTLDCSNEDFIINNNSIWDGQTFFELYKKKFFYRLIEASFNIHSSKSKKLIPQYAAISGTKDNFVIPGWVLISRR